MTARAGCGILARYTGLGSKVFLKSKGLTDEGQPSSGTSQTSATTSRHALKVHHHIDAMGTVNYSSQIIDVRQTGVFAKWLLELRDSNAVARILTRIRRIETGNFGDVKPVGEGICEARLSYGPSYRLYFIQQGKKVVILLCGGDKSTQAQDIVNAKRMSKEI